MRRLRTVGRAGGTRDPAPRRATRSRARVCATRRTRRRAKATGVTKPLASRRVLRIPRHRATTAHLCSAYPFLAESGLGPRGVYLGTNVLTGGGGFAFDPFEAYAAGTLTNPNML